MPRRRENPAVAVTDDHRLDREDGGEYDGEHDDVTHSHGMHYDTVPNARVEQLPGFGHFPMLEAPEQTDADRYPGAMWAPESPPDWTSVEIAVPRQSQRLPGISMAGFGLRVPALADIAMVAHPSVTLFVDLSEGDGLVPGVQGVHGRSERGRPSDQWPAARGDLCLQIRLPPVVATALLGASTELVGTVVSLEDVRGHDAGRAEDRLRAATSWDERSTIAADVLGRRLDVRPPLDPEIAAWWRIRTSRGRVRVGGLANEVGWSRRRRWFRPCRPPSRGG
jgi:hypothetical protein